MFWAWGLLGAFCYGGSALIFRWYGDDATPAKRQQAVAYFFLALVTGATGAGGFTHPLHSLITLAQEKGLMLRIDVPAGTVALTIGWVSNYIWPKLLKWLGRKVDSDALGVPKP
jgi:hypothetical protein